MNVVSHAFNTLPTNHTTETITTKLLSLTRPAADAFSTMAMAARDGRRHQAAETASSPAERAELTIAAGAGDPDAVLPTPTAAVSRGGFFAALGSSAVLAAAVVAAPKEASANGMLDFPPARLNNRYFLMRSGQGGADKEGRVQSHPIDKLHMDNRLTEQGVEEVRVYLVCERAELWRLGLLEGMPSRIDENGT